MELGGARACGDFATAADLARDHNQIEFYVNSDASRAHKRNFARARVRFASPANDHFPIQMALLRV